MLQTRQLDIRVGERLLCRSLDLQVQAGESWLILGENGCGKSTLLATLAGWRQPAGGEILLQGQALAGWPARQRARTIAWMTQQDDCPFPLTVMEKTLTGCHPRLGRWQWESAEDLALAQQQLQRLDLAGLAERDLATLSGGERRRASLATALLQQAELLLLDEPLSQLDLRHQQQALGVLREEQAQGRTIMLVGHDPNHARQFASHVLLLHGDGRWQAGPTTGVLTADNLSALYHHPIRTLADTGGQPWFVPA